MGEVAGISVVLVDDGDPVWLTHAEYDERWPAAAVHQAITDARRPQSPARAYPCPGSVRVLEPAAAYPVVQCDVCGFTVCVGRRALEPDGDGEPAQNATEAMPF